MNFNLTVSSYNPRTDALIIAELIKNHCKQVIDVEWCKDSKTNKNALLRNSTTSLLSEKDLNIGRYFARTIDPNLYGSCKPSDRTEIDHWLSFAIGPLESSILKHKALSYLNHALASKTWLSSKKLTIADVYVFSTLFENQLLTGREKEYPNIARWYQQMLSLPDIITALSAIEQQKILSKAANTAEKSVEMKVQQNDNKQEGKFIDLPGAEMGKIVVRFPPEPSGYLHIGHAKAVLLNQYYADTFQGKLIVRFDDTNPAKENEQFTNAILEDLELLQIKSSKITRTSDYFDLILEYCTKLIKDGKAYVDDTPNEIMKEQRERKEPSANRENSVEKNLMLWKEMQQGTTKGQECCVRAKIDYKSMNGCLRDPTIYRCKLETHPQTGKKYFVYPTYDFACPIVDSIEGITHTLRTTEYHDRDDQFYWFIDALGIRRPYIWEYSRLNMTNTVLSKRRLTWFVSEGLVDGWDDPRLPTVRGILRRGMTVDGLKQFIIAQGSSRSVVFMEWDKIWAFNKKIIDPIAHRYTALNCAGMVPVHVVDATNGWLTVQNHPKDVSKGTKTVHISPNIFIEQSDADMLVEGQNATFINWGNLLIQKIDRSNGVVRKIQAKLNLEDKNYKNTLKITWLSAPCENNTLVQCYAVYFDHIIKKPILGKDDDFKDFVATNTRTEVEMLGETELKRVKKGEIIELQRKGFFRCDVPYDFSSFSSREQPIILFHIPDGRASSTGVNRSNNTVDKKTKMNTQKCDKNAKVEKSEKQADISTELQSSPQLKSTSDKALIDNIGVKLENQLVEGSEKIKQLRDLLKQEETKLQNLRTEYMNKTGVEWDIKKTHASVTSSCTNDEGNVDMHLVDINKVSSDIEKQGNKIRQLKSSKAAKEIIDKEVALLLTLKSNYKKISGGQEWKPPKVKESCPMDKVPVAKSVTSSCTNDEGNADMHLVDINKVSSDIEIQGNKIRQLKSSKAAKEIIDKEVALLLTLKSNYKKISGGQEWKPPKVKESCPTDKVPVAKSVTSSCTNDEGNADMHLVDINKVSSDIEIQGNKIRQLKSSKAAKEIIDKEVALLLTLKSNYKKISGGQDWKPPKVKESCPMDKVPVAQKKMSESEISKEIQKQGDKVRELKSTKADKSTVEAEVKVLLHLKEEYALITGKPWQQPKQIQQKSGGNGKSSAVKSTHSKNDADTKTLDVTKTGTRLGLEAKKKENFFEWYSQVITKSGMIEYYDVSGCYVLRPWSYGIWKIIKEYIDTEITSLGVQECYFPIFVTRAVLEKEKAHIADFAPEVAWVTKCGSSDLVEPIAIRPTSETVMYPAYAKWLRSDTELPLKLNQWNNVVRWEFKDPKPFLRTREFLWQEGHTAFATKAEADEEVLTILDMYSRVYEELLAVPVVKGRKTEKEKFAGGEYTTTVEAFISTSGRAIQGATSHHLGQNFSKMFNIQVEGTTTDGVPAEGDGKTFVYQNSWGLTTRTIGVMIMVHGDDKGLVLPPKVSSIQAVLVPCGITATTTVEERDLLQVECDKLVKELSKDKTLRLKADYRNNRTPGWKFNHWELKGVPVRIELGPKDLKKDQVTLVRRDTFERIVVKRGVVREGLQKLLCDIQNSMFIRAKKDLDEHILKTEDWNDFGIGLDNRKILLSPFCGNPSCEEKIKMDSARQEAGEELGALSMGAKSLCIPFEQPQLNKPVQDLHCIHPDCCNQPKFYTLFGRSY